MHQKNGGQHPDRQIRQSLPVRGRVRGWFFRVEELSTGHWHVRGRDQHGKTVSCIGTSPEQVLNDAESEAMLLSGRSVVPVG
jgi:hypothetical protein